MIKYICENCNDLECETSKCPNCNSRTKIKESKIFWCDNCQIPLYTDYCSCCNGKGRYIGTDIRPVFPEERLMIEIICDRPFEFAGKSIWNTTGNNYILDGKKIKFSVKDTLERYKAKDISKRINELKEKNEYYEENFYNEKYLLDFLNANKIHLNEISTEAMKYIQSISQEYRDDEMFVSFSGGKDSTVTSDLVMKALMKENIIHIYGDTTLEYFTTADYIKEFKRIHPTTPMLVAKNKEQDFNELCKVIGPPSRMMRWCCTIFKTGAITRKIESTFRNTRNILTFQGIRRNESTARSKYDRESTESKIAKQIAVSPIIDWQEFDVWLYILANNIAFNKAYRYGFSRVGCWCCPNNSNWSEFLSAIYMPDKYITFHNILTDFAKKIGKPDPIEYVEQGGWKARQGGNGLEFSKNAVIEVKPCALIENTYNFELNKPLNEILYELFKPFGNIDFTIGNKRLNEVYVLNKKNNLPILKISGRLGQCNIKISVLRKEGIFKDDKRTEMLIKNQITKFQTCIGCLACESQCKYNAIKITNVGAEKKVDYKIDSNKCIGCLNCVTHFSGGCYMKKILRTKKEN